MVILENDKLKVSVSEHGAELTSVIDKSLERECIWVADPAVWNRHAPILFPFVGNCRNKEYRFNGKTYPMTQHGFARDYDFTVVEAGADKAVFTLESTEEMKERYPFDWSLTMIYTLTDNQLKIEYYITNKDDKAPMYFSLGGHPGFMYEGNLEEQQFEINTDEDLDRLELNMQAALFSRNITRGFVKGGAPIVITPHIFDNDAMVFHNFRFTEIALVNRNSRHGVTMQLSGFPYIGLWSMPGAPYACIEPWYGLADFDDFFGELPEKDGVEMLEAGKTFEAGYNLIFY